MERGLKCGCICCEEKERKCDVNQEQSCVGDDADGGIGGSDTKTSEKRVFAIHITAMTFWL